MMNRSSDIMFMAEYIKNILYFATVRQGKTLKSTLDTHYFCIDNDLIYENYYSDFGPLNLGCVYKYCRIVNEKINQAVNNQTVVHYTSIDPKKKANSAFLIGCYGVLYLNLSPKDALKPLIVHGQNYRPFQDATQGDSNYTISLMDCLQALKKARDLGFFNFQDFNYEEYERLDKIQGGDLNWIVPGKFLAFIGPVDYTISLYHPPEMYIGYFLENNVKIVIRLNRRVYNGNVFNNVGIVHYDLFFPDGSCPPRHILFKFLQISEEADCAIAVHCKAGLGRTGSLIGSYLIKHYRMTSHEAIGWMRICRPGSVIGHQQGWLEQLEPWLLKQGNIYRRHTWQDPDKLPFHEFGIYSLAESHKRHGPVVFQNSSSPPLLHKTRPSDLASPPRSQTPRIKDDKSNNEEDVEEREIYLTSCDLTSSATGPTIQLKGCVLKSTRSEESCDSYVFGNLNETTETSSWRKYLCCRPCFKILNDILFIISVRCASVTPKKCNSYACCGLLNLAALNKTTEKERDWSMKLKSINNNQRIPIKSDKYEVISNKSQRSSGAGDPKAGRPSSPISGRSTILRRDSGKSRVPSSINARPENTPITTFRTSQPPLIKSVNDAKNFLMRSSIYNRERDKHINSSVTITPQARGLNYMSSAPGNANVLQPPRVAAAPNAIYSFCPLAPNAPPFQSPYRRRLGRSPSPPARMTLEQSRATNTPTLEKTARKEASKSSLKDVLSRVKSKLNN